MRSTAPTNDEQDTTENMDNDNRPINIMECEREKNVPIGDRLDLDKPPGTTRIYMQNVNGFQLTPGGTYATACQHLKDMDVDHAMFCEHKLDTTKP